MLRSLGAMLLTSRSPMRISPALASSSPAIMRRMVDLPQPDGPTSTTNSSCATSRSMPRTASTAPNRLRSPFSASCAMRDAQAPAMRRATSRASIASASRLRAANASMRLALVRDVGAVAREARRQRCRRRAAVHGAHGDEVLRRGEAPELGFGEVRGPADRRGEYLLERAERNRGQRHAAVDHAARQPARHLVRLAERDRLGAHQRIGELGQRDAGFVDMAAHLRARRSRPPRAIRRAAP